MLVFLHACTGMECSLTHTRTSKANHAYRHINTICDVCIWTCWACCLTCLYSGGSAHGLTLLLSESVDTKQALILFMSGSVDTNQTLTLANLSRYMFFNTPTTSYGIIGITIGLLGGILFTVAKLRVSKEHVYWGVSTRMHTCTLATCISHMFILDIGFCDVLHVCACVFLRWVRIHVQNMCMHVYEIDLFASVYCSSTCTRAKSTRIFFNAPREIDTVHAMQLFKKAIRATAIPYILLYSFLCDPFGLNLFPSI
jgi:hypothetical protein